MILEVKGIDTFYGLGHILHGLSLGVNQGEVVALLGRNGAGKTTTLRSVTGLTPFTALRAPNDLLRLFVSRIAMSRNGSRPPPRHP